MADIQNKLTPHNVRQRRSQAYGQNSSLGRRLCAALAGLFLATIVSACGSGSADEPYSPGPRVVGGSIAGSSASNSVAQAPNQIGVSTSTITLPADATVGEPDFGECNIDFLNATRFVGSGLIATGIDFSSQCGFCPSAEICTRPDGVCHCVVVNVVN